MTCDAKIRPFPNPTEVACELTEPHEQHSGAVLNYAYSGSRTVIRWYEDDRRTFHGDWPGDCDSPGCTLPSGHHGSHAT